MSTDESTGDTQVPEDAADEATNAVIPADEAVQDVVPAEDDETINFPFSSEFFKNAPPELKTFLQMTSMSGPIPNPFLTALARQLQPEHVTMFIESMDKTSEREEDNTQRARWTHLVYVVVVLIFAGIAIFLMKDSNPDLLKDLITYGTLAVGGLGGGFGFKAWMDRKNQ